jgi:hypothetical protein
VTLPKDRSDRENQRFRDTGLPDKTRVAVVVEASDVAISGAPPAGNPVVFNVAMPLANTEYSHPFSASTKGFEIKTRNFSTLQVSFVMGGSGTTYFTIPNGSSYDRFNLDLAAETIYFQSPSASETVEIIEWS